MDSSSLDSLKTLFSSSVHPPTHPFNKNAPEPALGQALGIQVNKVNMVATSKLLTVQQGRQQEGTAAPPYTHTHTYTHVRARAQVQHSVGSRARLPRFKYSLALQPGTNYFTSLYLHFLVSKPRTVRPTSQGCWEDQKS